LFELADQLKTIFGLKFVRIVGDDKPIKNIGILGGDGSDFMVQIEALKENVDAYITGDFRYTRGLYAKENNLAVIELPHSIENVFIDHVFNQIKELEVEVIKTQINTDPFKYY
jgi:putative NIF3 family GTP cyclohydrolase 1 type 2